MLQWWQDGKPAVNPAPALSGIKDSAWVIALVFAFIFQPVWLSTTHVSWPVEANFSDVAMLPNLSNYLGEFNVILTDRTDGKSYENKTQVIINQSFSLKSTTPRGRASWQWMEWTIGWWFAVQVRGSPEALRMIQGPCLSNFIGIWLSCGPILLWNKVFRLITREAIFILIFTYLYKWWTSLDPVH